MECAVQIIESSKVLTLTLGNLFMEKYLVTTKMTSNSNSDHFFWSVIYFMTHYSSILFKSCDYVTETLSHITVN